MTAVLLAAQTGGTIEGPRLHRIADPAFLTSSLNRADRSACQGNPTIIVMQLAFRGHTPMDWERSSCLRGVDASEQW
jgi:hypothetical protein